MEDLQDVTDEAPENTGSMAEPPEVEAPRRRINEWSQRRKDARRARRSAVARAVPDRSPWAILGVIVLGGLVLAIVGVGLHTALGPLRDTALAAHLEPSAATLYWIGVDGLIVVAIIAAVILRHDPWARWYALGIVGLYTFASGLLQFLHGLGWTAPDPVTGRFPPLPWPVVATVAVLVIGTIFAGTHLLVYVLRHLFPRALIDQGEQLAEGTSSASDEDHLKINRDSTGDSNEGDGPDENGRPEPDEPLVLDAEKAREIAKWHAAVAVHLILDAGGKPVRAKIAGSFGIAERQAGYVIADVIADREDADARQAEQDAARVLAEAGPEPIAAVNGSPRIGVQP